MKHTIFLCVITILLAIAAVALFSKSQNKSPSLTSPHKNNNHNSQQDASLAKRKTVNSKIITTSTNQDIKAACEQHFLQGQTQNTIKRLMYSNASGFARKLEGNPRNASKRRKIFHLAGFSIEDSEALQRGFLVDGELGSHYRAKRTTHIPVSLHPYRFVNRQHDRTDKQNIEASTLIYRGNFEALYRQLENRELSAQNFYDPESTALSILQRDAQFDNSKLQLLHSSGFPITANTVVRGISHNLNSELVREITHIAVQEDPKSFQDEFKYSLLGERPLGLLATEKFRDDVVQIIAAKGLGISSKHYNLFDAVRQPTNAQELRSVINIVQLAIKAGQRPTLVSVTQKLQQILPKDVYHQLENELSPKYESTDEELQLAEQLRAMVDSYEIEIEEAQAFEQTCRQTQEVDEIQLFSEKSHGLTDLTEMSLEQKIITAKAAGEKQKAIWQQQRHKDTAVNPNWPKQPELTEALLASLNKNRFDDAKAILEEMHSLDLLASGLHTVIEWGLHYNNGMRLPKSFYQYIVEHAREMRYGTAAIIIRKDALPFFKALTINGLDLEMRNAQNENLLYAKSILGSAQTVKYLLDAGLNPSEPHMALDLLDRELELIHHTRVIEAEPLAAVKAIIEAGAPVRRSHIERLRLINASFHPTETAELNSYFPQAVQ